MTGGLIEQTAEFRAALSRAATSIVPEIAPGRPGVIGLLETYLGEVPTALDALDRVLDSPRRFRILEVGSGIGAVAACLRFVGHEVVALEPRGPGFETAAVPDFRGSADILLLQRVISTASEECGVPADTGGELTIDVDGLDPRLHGRFDVVFSVNVLEHVPDSDSALARMQSVLVDGGKQRHVCPNYAFPYEPHFFLPLVPFVPSLTRLLLPGRITQTGLWESLNFVTARQVRRWARRASVEVRFDRGVLAEAVERFLADPVFAERHAGLGRVVRLLQRLGVVPLLRGLPARIVSPMRFTVT